MLQGHPNILESKKLKKKSFDCLDISNKLIYAMEYLTIEPNFLEIIGNQYEFKNNVKYSFQHYFLEPDFDKIKSNPTCSICLNDCNSRKLDKLSNISCGHHFHSQCINKWLEKNLCCPLCRKRCAQQRPRYSLDTSIRKKFIGCEYEYTVIDNIYYVNHKINKERKWTIDERDVNLVLDQAYNTYTREYQRELHIGDVITALVENELDLVNAIMELVM